MDCITSLISKYKIYITVIIKICCLLSIPRPDSPQIQTDEAYVQVVGSMTNEGQVDICNLTISISSLETATYKNPAWLPNYPKTQSFKSGTYFPFTAILPMNAGSSASYRYPTVDVKMGFYACDAALKALPEDKIVPPPGNEAIVGRGR